MADDTTTETTDTTADTSTREITPDDGSVTYTTIGTATVEFGNLFESCYVEEVGRELWKEIATGDIFSKAAATAIYKGTAKFRHGAYVFKTEDGVWDAEFPNQFLNPNAESTDLFPTWWIILDVSETALPKEIKVAYRSLFGGPDDDEGGQQSSGIKSRMPIGPWTASCDYLVTAWCGEVEIDGYGPWKYRGGMFKTKDDAWVASLKYGYDKDGLRFQTEEAADNYEEWLKSVVKMCGDNPDLVRFRTLRCYGPELIHGTASASASGNLSPYAMWLRELNTWLKSHGYTGEKIT